MKDDLQHKVINILENYIPHLSSLIDSTNLFTPLDIEKQFGINEGNGAVPNGTFIYTGFKPRFVLIKNIDAVESWIMYDTKRDPFNLTSTKLSPDQANVENGASGIGDAAYNNIDLYSNGFKCKTNNASSNAADDTIMYMAFAQEPFVTSSGVPATAR